MPYKVADLKYIFVRVGAKNVNLEEMNDSDFIYWAENKFQITIKNDENAEGTPWSLQDKVDFLNGMSERAGNKPVVVMLKH